MKITFNISDPVTGNNKKVVIEDEEKVRFFLEKRVDNIIDGEVLGPEFKGYQLKITGGNDFAGKPMIQGIFCNKHVRILMKDGNKGYRCIREGVRERKCVRGAIVGQDITSIQLSIVKRGEQQIVGFTDVKKPIKLGPKRASHIRKMFALDKKTGDVRKYVVRKEIVKGEKKHHKSPKIQRLITKNRLRRKKTLLKARKTHKEAQKKLYGEYVAKTATFHKMLDEKRNKAEKKDVKA